VTADAPNISPYAVNPGNGVQMIHPSASAWIVEKKNVADVVVVDAGQTRVDLIAAESETPTSSKQSSLFSSRFMADLAAVHCDNRYREFEMPIHSFPNVCITEMENGGARDTVAWS
jgi:hypothetical protein